MISSVLKNVLRTPLTAALLAWGLAGGIARAPAIAPVQDQSRQDQSSPSDQSESVPTISVNVHLVNVFVSVMDREGAPVGKLAKEDFVLFEEGSAQRIAVFERDTSAPLSMVLALDTSGSVHKDFAEEQEAARHFVHATLRSQDRLDLMAFSDSVREVVGFTNNERRIDNALNSFHASGGTAFYSGIYLASELLGPEHGRKVLVVISDGGNTLNGTTYQQALEQAIRNEVMIYSIIDVPVASSAGRDLAGEHAMITLAEGTGGRYFYADSAPLEQIFARISEDLRTQYLLGYYPAPLKKPAAFRTIAVKLRNADANAKSVVRNRPGYYPTSER